VNKYEMGNNFGTLGKRKEKKKEDVACVKKA
jgi:hypothetical protein